MADNNSAISLTDHHFDFLAQVEVQDHFADLNIQLLRGCHINKDDYYLFNLLDNYKDELRHYYESLYNLSLTEDKLDNDVYYYLDFFPDNKSKLSSTSRHKELTETQIVTGLMLLNMYHERYFEYLKEIEWEDIKNEIQDGENSNLYKKLLFGQIRDNYTDNEWGLKVKKRLRQALQEFETLGWVKRTKQSNKGEWGYILKPSINRLAKLYGNEIANFDQFVEEYRMQKQK